MRKKIGQKYLITDTSQTPKKSHTRYFGSQNDYVISGGGISEILRNITGGGGAKSQIFVLRNMWMAS